MERGLIVDNGAMPGRPPAPAGGDAARAAVEAAVDHPDEHVIKFTDTAAEVFAWTGDAAALAAAARVAELIDPP